MVVYTFRPFVSRGKSPWDSLDRTLGVFHRQYGRCRVVATVGNRTPVPRLFIRQASQLTEMCMHVFIATVHMTKNPAHSSKH